jgi:hypothetical protein
VADGTLAAFCGAGDGFVKTWHSQTGSNDATQTTAGYQPKIVSSGVVITEAGKPAILFDGSDDFFSAGSVAAMNGSVTMSFVTDIKVNGDFRTLFSYGGAVAGGILLQRIGIEAGVEKNTIRYYDNGGTFRIFDFQTLVTSDGQTHLCVVGGNRPDVSVWKNAVDETKSGTANANSTNTLEIGRRTDNTSQYWYANVSEIVFWQSDLTQSVDLITGNTMWYY